MSVRLIIDKHIVTAV